MLPFCHCHLNNYKLKNYIPKTHQTLTYFFEIHQGLNLAQVESQSSGTAPMAWQRQSVVDLSLVTFPWPYPKNQELSLSESSMSCVQDLGLRSWMVAIIYAAFDLHLKGGAGGV